MAKSKIYFWVFPTLEEVNEAPEIIISLWKDFLPDPLTEREEAIFNRILERAKELGLRSF